MAAERRGQKALNIDLSTNANNAAPPISALFLIHFDIKAGYTIRWKQSLPGIELEGVVEYKSLPSGLHTVKEDLIYFVHEDHAGLSAFINAPASEEARNARMIAVGVLVPLSYGRLGRAWKHAEVLKEMARKLIEDAADTKLLEDFWEEHKAKGSTPAQDAEFALDSPSSIVFKRVRAKTNKPKHGRNRSASDGTALLPPGHNLSAYHPAWSLPALLDTSGPLIFPIQRAALLRKRILITTHAPVEQACNFVYDLSILSNIPLAVIDLLSPDCPPQRLRPLFQIGIHDIPYLEADLQAMRQPPPTSAATSPGSESPREEPGTGWIACTTDSILAMKSHLYDILITLPEPHSKDAAQKQWPKVVTSEGVVMKATQRDLRRYKALLWGLSRHDLPSPSKSPKIQSSSSDTILRTKSSTSVFDIQEDSILTPPDTDAIIEPLSWSAYAYTGYMWWASAGSSQTLSSTEQEEADSDSILLSGLPLTPNTTSPSATKSQSQSTSSTSLLTSNGTLSQAKKEGEARQEMAIVAYFHRLTSQILTTLSDIIDSEDSDDEREAEHHQLVSTTSRDDEEDTGPRVYVNSTDVARMGLDVWSAGDLAYVEDVSRLWFGRKAEVEGKNVDVCGVRVC